MGCCSKPETNWVCTEFEITLISATNLEGRTFRTTRVYAGVSICGGPEEKTPVDMENGTNPTLNFNAIHPIEDDSELQHYCSMVVMKLYYQRRVFRDPCIGQVVVQLKELRDRRPTRHVDYRVYRGSQVTQGTLRFSYRFGRTKAAGNPYSWIKRAFDRVIPIVALAVPGCVAS